MNKQDRYFVTIKTKEKVAFARLLNYDVRTFRSTGSFDGKEKEFTVDGVLTLEQISHLVRDGYTVEVRKHAPRKGLPSSQLISLSEWTEAISEEQKHNKTQQSNFQGGENFPPNGYHDAASIALVLWILSIKYPSICKLYHLPEPSHEGRVITYVKISGGTGTNRQGVLFIGGVHGEELVNPDLLASLAFDLCRAYREGAGLEYGGKSFSSSYIKQIIDGLEIFIVPLVNPDGREYAINTDTLWRMNRNPNPGMSCMGVDINRNFDFLWSSGIYSSPDPCSPRQIFKGNTPFSEPETRNVRYLLDNFPNIKYMIDVHSFGEIVGYPWAIDVNQSTDPSMNFQNPFYDGMRGYTSISEPPGYVYSEYIPQIDWRWYINTAKRVRDAIFAVRDRPYKDIQSALIYRELFNMAIGISATSEDYAYARNFVDHTKGRVYALTFETGRWFNPVDQDNTSPQNIIPNEKPNIIKEISAGLIEFCLNNICVVEETVRGTAVFKELVDLRRFRDEELLKNKAGAVYVTILEDNVGEILDIVKDDKKIHSQAVNIITRLNKVIKSSSMSTGSKKKSRSLVIDANLVKDIEDLLRVFENKASPRLRNAIQQASTDLKHFSNKTIKEGLEAASRE